jgi:hypothetical protein
MSLAAVLVLVALAGFIIAVIVMCWKLFQHAKSLARTVAAVSDSLNEASIALQQAQAARPGRDVDYSRDY